MTLSALCHGPCGACAPVPTMINTAQAFAIFRWLGAPAGMYARASINSSASMHICTLILVSIVVLVCTPSTCMQQATCGACEHKLKQVETSSQTAAAAARAVSYSQRVRASTPAPSCMPYVQAQACSALLPGSDVVGHASSQVWHNQCHSNATATVLQQMVV